MCSFVSIHRVPERQIPLDLFKGEKATATKRNSAIPSDTSHNLRLHSAKTEEILNKSAT